MKNNEVVHVTPEMVKEYISNVIYQKVEGTNFRVCVLTTLDGTQVLGTAVHQRTVEDVEEVGNKWAYEDAFSKVYALAIVYYNCTKGV